MSFSRLWTRSPARAGILPPRLKEMVDIRDLPGNDPGLSHRQTPWKGGWWGGEAHGGLSRALPNGDPGPRGLLPWESMGLGSWPEFTCHPSPVLREALPGTEQSAPSG